MTANSQASPVLQISSLRVSYFPAKGKPVHALENIGLEVCAAEVVGILGESGCGKSTLAASILRLLPAHARVERGEILFHNRDLLGLSEYELDTVRGRDISLVSQDPALSLNPVMTVGSQIAEVLRAHLTLRGAQRRERAKELLGQMGFDHPADIYRAYPHQLSGGQRQRVVIAQAVACRPSLIIADEPTSKLDVSLRLDVLALLSKLRDQYGIALLVISHDPALFLGFADRVAIMYAGRIVEIGKCADVFARPFHPYSEALMRTARASAIDDVDGPGLLPVIAGDPPDPTTVVPGCRFEPRCPDRMGTCAWKCPPEFAPTAERAVTCFKYAE